MTAWITRDVLLKWANQHRQNAKRLREEAARLLHEAAEAERKAGLCEQDATDGTYPESGSPQGGLSAPSSAPRVAVGDSAERARAIQR